MSHGNGLASAASASSLRRQGEVSLLHVSDFESCTTTATGRQNVAIRQGINHSEKCDNQTSKEIIRVRGLTHHDIQSRKSFARLTVLSPGRGRV